MKFLNIKQKIETEILWKKKLSKHLFLSHLFKEPKSEWIYKPGNGKQFLAYHPDNSMPVTVRSQFNYNIGDLCALTLKWPSEWLVQLKSAGYRTTRIRNVKMDRQHLDSMFSSWRPVASIVSKLDLDNRPFIFQGQLGPLEHPDDNFSHVFHSHKRGFPSVLLTADQAAQVPQDYDGSLYFHLQDWRPDTSMNGQVLTLLPTGYDQMSVLQPSTQSPSLKKHQKINEGPVRPASRMSRRPDFSSVAAKLMADYGVNPMLQFPSAVCKQENSMLQAASMTQYAISSDECGRREQLENKVVFSVDPEDARDIDDALHVERLTNAPGQYEVGVHIADVSHFVATDSAIDREARHRATSVYLKHKVIPMLPDFLSSGWCSLNTEQDKLAFSVIFRLNELGDVLDTRFTKTVIRSKMQLTYGQAQRMLHDTVTEDDNLHRANPHFSQVCWSIKKLDQFAQIFRATRIARGALSFPKVELKFELETPRESSVDLREMKVEGDEEAAIVPAVAVRPKQYTRANELIEEWMLKANMAVAHKLYHHALSSEQSRRHIGALLRAHPPPTKLQEREMKRGLLQCGITETFLRSRDKQTLITRIAKRNPDRAQGVSFICYLNMQLALYCCAEDHILFSDLDARPEKLLQATTDTEEDEQQQEDEDFPFRHYGLAVPLYTHFTSPIRRYADLLVHRQLAALQYPGAGGSLDVPPLASRLEATHNCNKRRVATRRLNDRLSELYLASYLATEGWHAATAQLLALKNQTLLLLLPSVGVILRPLRHHLMPWATHFVKRNDWGRTGQLSLQANYSPLADNCNIDNSLGFPRYLFSDPAKEEPDADCKSEDEEVSEPEVMAVATRNLRLHLMRPVPCIVYCSAERWEIRVELPYPPSQSSLFKRSTTKWL